MQRGGGSDLSSSFDDNPDHLAVFRDPVVVATDGGIYPETPFRIASSPSGPAPANLGRRASAPVIGVDHPQNPGEVMLFKEAKPVSGMVNAWDVTLRVEGKDSKRTSDIVLVIDCSGSMTDDGRMAAAKSAANSFIDTLLAGGDGNARIAVVSYADEVFVESALTNDSASLKRAVNGLIASGGTFTQGGIRQAEELLANSDADVKDIVLLSDGEPTYSYGIRNPENYVSLVTGGNYGGMHYETTEQVPREAYTATRVGTGGWTSPSFAVIGGLPAYYNHGNSAVAEAGFAKGDGYTVWTIALEAGVAGNAILNRIATADHAFTGTPSDLQDLFQVIASRINSAVKQASVSDPMGEGFRIPVGSVGSIRASQGTPSYDEAAKLLSWDDIGLLDKPVVGDPSIKYAEMSYRIEIDDSILDAVDTGGMYATNGDARLAYVDTAGDAKEASFPVPTVDPVLLVVEKRLYDKSGNQVTDDDSQIFSIRITSDGGYDQTYALKAGERRIMTNLRFEDTYAVSENGYPSGMSASDYDTVVSVYGSEVDTFKIMQGDEDTPVLVTNYEIPTLTLAKSVTGEMADKTRKFNFDVSISRGGATILDDARVSLADGESQLIDALLPSGTFLHPNDQITVTEIDADGYAATYTVGDGTIQSSGTGISAGFALSGDTVVRFTNERRGVPVTGTLFPAGGSALPVVLGVGIGLAAASVAVTRFGRVGRGE